MRVGVALLPVLLVLSGCLSDDPKEPVPEPTVEHPPLDGILPVVSGNYTVPDPLQGAAAAIAATSAVPITPEDILYFRSSGHSLFRFQALEPFAITNWTGSGTFGKVALVLYPEGATLPTAACGVLDPAKFRMWYKAAGYETNPTGNDTLPAGVYRAVVGTDGPVEISLKLGEGTNSSVEVAPVDFETAVTYLEPAAWTDNMPPGTGSSFTLEIPIDQPSFIFTAMLGSPLVAAGAAEIHSSLAGGGGSCAEDGRSSDMSGWAPYNQYGPRVAATWLSGYVFTPGPYVWSASYTWTLATPIGTRNAEALVVPFPPA